MTDGRARAEATPGSSALIPHARGAARYLLTGLGDGGRRWRHTQAVADRAMEAARILAPPDAERLQAAAWLHDIGYAPALSRYRFHPIDGAHHVQRVLGDPVVAGLVAHHSGARFVAAACGLAHLMVPFAHRGYWAGPLADALTWADQTIGPDGRPMDVEERIREALRRHSSDGAAARSQAQRALAVTAAVRATEARLARSGPAG
ncbi:HD domain-containing protein [Amnibacterium sp. CER49]|uniref:HD domain-containing protein n=1 Tax=Amnibacterium sp. CER49 TaxID=3039161 RepID=UPI002448107A|nr:HD domain-containing protein [Amnibacterium sp. CER49]MDH2444089.1 HD domain-containing protein [Amnibacterium sp. CER49]